MLTQLTFSINNNPPEDFIIVDLDIDKEHGLATIKFDSHEGLNPEGFSLHEFTDKHGNKFRITGRPAGPTEVGSTQPPITQ